MSAGDIADSAAWMMLAWAIGYCTGFLFKVVRNMIEVSIGGGG